MQEVFSFATDSECQGGSVNERDERDTSASDLLQKILTVFECYSASILMAKVSKDW